MKKLTTTIAILLTVTASYAQIYTVERVIDGNTLKLTNGEEVRLTGVDVPVVFEEGIDLTLYDPGEEERKSLQRWGVDIETLSNMGQEATEFVKSLGIEGEEVRLEFDVQKKDIHGRLLRYAYIETCYPDCPMTPFGFQYYEKIDELKYIFLNATIVNSGYATPTSVPPNVKYADLFEKLFQEAQEGKRGLWKGDPEEEMIFCPADVRECPDGSYVSRMPPGCEFKTCPE